jgi:hypothetical protein
MCLIQWYGWKVICISLVEKIMDVKDAGYVQQMGLMPPPITKNSLHDTLMFWLFLTTNDL